MALPKIQDVLANIAKMSAREKAILYAVCIFVSIAVVDRLMIAPVIDKIRALDGQIKEREAGIKKSVRILSQKDRIETEGAKYGPLLAASKSDDEEVTMILKEIERLGSKSSVYIVDMKPGGIKSHGDTKKFIVNLSCEAQIEQIIDFMFNIEGSRKLLTIEKYQIAPKSKSSSIAQCSMTISKITMK